MIKIKQIVFPLKEQLLISKKHLSFNVVLLLTLLPFYAVAQKSTVRTDAGDIKVEVLAENLDHPWGMAFLPDKRLLVTERAGTLRIYDEGDSISQPIKGTPEVFSQGQGGLLDVALDPEFEQNKYVYLSFAEPGKDSTASTALGRGRFEDNQINDFEVIFRMEPKVEGPNHFGGRIVFARDEMLFLTLGERFKFEPAQDLSSHLGTIVRINKDGSVPQDNPFLGDENARDEIWSYGHRNIESAAIDPESGLLWIAEMGPLGGDEFNQPEAGRNYGWPKVSWGDNYDGSKIPDPEPDSEFADAVFHWTPTISPSGLIFYTGSMYPEWQNSALIGGLTSSGLVRMEVNGEQAEEVERIPLNVRVRDVEQAPDGSIYVLTDEDNGKILRLKAME
ncbi:PQQ-dependent sugar dehydrogenase [Autumnicola psychrophila]|uniref:PQQ-dependent sugar dehydrogenase n=1 Tax=Autumnicola psychrophila TaxID=3075592 RepID=A0ABU3DQP5_9FLAO|nr:PQQ-dependent sugar dehydrogenase [Zunongwangia sp. F225]MDT0686042.1 PQQ-dependent sugar dehydrogenase [Zunongwangia sp. F225]